jgi:ferredoxin-NADP reductase
MDDAMKCILSGLGLAPVLSMLYELSRQDSPLPVHLIQVGRDYPRRLWDELQQLAGRLPTLHVERAEHAATVLAELEPSAHTATLLAGPSPFIEEVEPRLRAQSSSQDKGLLQVLALRQPEPSPELTVALATP